MEKVTKKKTITFFPGIFCPAELANDFFVLLQKELAGCQIRLVENSTEDSRKKEEATTAIYRKTFYDAIFKEDVARPVLIAHSTAAPIILEMVSGFSRSLQKKIGVILINPLPTSTKKISVSALDIWRAKFTKINLPPNLNYTGLKIKSEMRQEEELFLRTLAGKNGLAPLQVNFKNIVSPVKFISCYRNDDLFRAYWKKFYPGKNYDTYSILPEGSLFPFWGDEAQAVIQSIKDFIVPRRRLHRNI